MRDNQENVFFLEDITLEEEYHLVFPDETKNTKKDKVQRIFGNKLLPTSQNLRDTDFTLEDGRSYTDNSAELVMLALLNNKIFYNFIEDLDEKINRKIVYTPFINSLINYLKDYYKNNFRDFNDDFMNVYRMICKRIHDDLVDTHFFEEENWTSKIKKSYKSEKKIFEKYSPIVEIFHGKYEGQDGRTFYKIYRDHLDITVKEGTNDISGSVRDYFQSTNIKVNKYPLILVLKFENKKKLGVQDILTIERTKYNLSGFITYAEPTHKAYLNNHGKWLMCSDGSITSVDIDEKDKYAIFIAFYQIDRITN
ncbi:hypothetical protein THOM_1023 [Trachipleistophora hominis]|uniref:USP domain-containing protein n=1 Tax=Trachipleistophora hominis TaxID=72359 RepID=L7JXH7_TRAHO|nr:hypothetical protein THOM_1023 [Trachipleistophora hominis]